MKTRRAAAQTSLPALPDYGVDLGLDGAAASAPSASPFREARQGFVKFLGRSADREPASLDTTVKIARAGCHWALTYPTSKRPRAVADGALMFISRLTREPHDIYVFGRAIGEAHVEGRDEASPAELAARPWKADWSYYIRVHDAEFVAGSLANGVPLSRLMDALGPNAFRSTQRNHLARRGNTNPRRAYMQQPAVELTPEAMMWLNTQLERALARHGRVPAATLDEIGWAP